MPGKGLYVQCHSWAPKQQNRLRTVSRAFCLMRKEEYCSDCPHSQFTLRIAAGAISQGVSCPRWDASSGRQSGADPAEYVTVPRETCITTKPFEYCPSCPNSDLGNEALIQPGWYGKRTK